MDLSASLVAFTESTGGRLDAPALTFGLALAAGMIANTLAHHLKLPAIVLFLGAGLLLGPEVINIVRPHTLGIGLETIVGLAVAVILFEGGLNLNIGRLRRQARTIRQLVIVGAIVTGIGGTLAARFVMGWDWSLASLFGTLVIVTGPTVVTPLVRRIRLIPRLQTILEAEGVLIDPIGAIIAVVTLEIVLEFSAGSAAASALGVLGLPMRLLVGTAVGALGGLAIGWVLARERMVPEELHNVFTLALVLALFASSEAIAAESGIMAAPVAGIVVGNMRTRVHAELRGFKEALTTMLVGMLFVILAADVTLANVAALGMPGVITIGLLMFVVRPVDVALSTRGSALTLKERGFIAWIGPRGIVAAAVASLFAQRLAANGLEGGTELQALVFAVIAATVVLQGLSGEPIAAWLGLRRPRDQGYAIVGANGVGLALARVLRDGGHPVLVVDSNSHQAATAKEAGFEVIYGDASSATTLYRADVEGRRGFLATTLNDGANLMIANRAANEARNLATFVTVARDNSAVKEKQIKEDGHRVLFGSAVDIAFWDRALKSGDAGTNRWTYSPGDEPGGAAEIISGPRRADARVLPLGFERKGKMLPVDDRTVLQEGDVIMAATVTGQGQGVAEYMSRLGFSVLMEK